MNANIYATLYARFQHKLDATCIETTEGRIITFRELDQATARIANLLTGLGLEKEDRVAAQVDKSPEALILCLGVQRAGFAFLPLNAAYQTSEVAYFLENAAPKVVVCRAANLDAISAIAGGATVLTLEGDGSGALTEAAAGQSDHFATVTSADDDMAAILYTSGTTGRAKGAMLTHGNLSTNVAVTNQFWGWVPGDVLLHALPIFHVHGLFVACNNALYNASPMLWHAKFDAAAVLKDLARATVLMGVPTFYTRLLSLPDFGKESVANMRLFISGSAPLLIETFQEFTARTGHVILERYGMTEVQMAISNPWDGERIGGTVGLPLPGVSVRIVDEAGADSAPGETGAILLKGPNIFRGYWQMPEKTKEDFTDDGWFKTGDMGKRDAGGYISIVGRAKDLIICGGLNVYPKEIEELLDAVPSIEESAVIAMPHPDFGEAVAAVIVLKPGASLSEDAVVDHVKSHLANFKVPKAVFFTPDLPRNAMGKVQKNILRQTYFPPKAS